MSLRYWKFTSSLSLSKRVYLCRIPVEFITSNLHQAYFTHHLQYKSIHSVEVKDGNTSIQSIKTIQQCNSDQAICENIKLIGWVQSVRKHKSHVFCNISDGSSPYNLQVVMTPSQITNKITIGCALSIEGDIHPIPNILNKFQSSNRTPNTQCCGELHAKSVTILDCVKQPNELQTNELTDDSSLIHKKNVTTVNQVVSSIGRHSPRPDFGILRSIEGLSTRHKLPEFAAMLRMRAHIKQLVRKVMNSCNYLEVDTPILTTVDCEGSGQMFSVQSPPSKHKAEINDSSVFLTGSAQMHLESLALGLSKVYTLNPTFRAENSHTKHHLAEFYMLEAESVYLDNVDSLCTEIEMITKMILTECLQFYPDPTSNELNNLQHDLVLIRTFLGKQPVSEKPCPSESVDLATDFRKTLESVLEKPFARVSYNEAIKYVNKEMSTTDFNFKEPYDLSKQDEYKILDWFGGKRPVFITHFPLQLKPFYCQSIDGVNAECSDLLFPGVGELVGASVRETSTTLLRERMKSNNQCTDHSNWYIDLRNTGSVPHAGFGLGFERLLQYILDIANIRDTIAFPRNTYKITL